MSSLIKSRSSLTIVCVVLFLTFLDNTIVSVALSSIQSKLAAGVTDLQWVVDSYMLVFAVLMLFGGTMGDIFGRKKVMLSGVALFAAGSIVAASAGSVDSLIAGRVIMGLGAAASEPGTLSLIRHLYPDRKKRSKALGIWAAVSGIALAFGPIIGGVIVGFSDWKGVFLFSAIFGLLALIAGWLILPESADPSGRRLDITGLVAGGLAIAAVIVALIFGETYSYGSGWIITLFIVALLAGIAFVYIERRKPDPVLPVSFFKIPEFTLANVVAFGANFGIFAVFFFVALYLQLIVNYSGYHIALAFIAMSGTIVAGALLASRWSTGVRQTTLLTIFGCLTAAAGIFILNSLIGPNISVLTLSWVLAIAGIGFGVCLVSMTSAVLNIVPPQRSGMAASTVNTFRELGGVFGVAVLGSIVNAQLTGNLVIRLREFNLPVNFIQLVIYAITHGGHTPQSAHISISEIAAHASLIQQISQTANQAFANGLSYALDVAGGLFLLIAFISIGVYVYQSRNLSLYLD